MKQVVTPAVMLALVLAQPLKCGVEEPAVSLAVGPEYPALANLARVSGEVVVVVKSDASGSPVAVSVVRGHPLLNESAVQAAREWRFRTAGQATLTFTFSLVPENACIQKVLPRFRGPYGAEVAARRLAPSCDDCPKKPQVSYEQCR